MDADCIRLPRPAHVSPNKTYSIGLTEAELNTGMVDIWASRGRIRVDN